MQPVLQEDAAADGQKSTALYCATPPLPQPHPCPLLLIHCRHLSAEKIEADREGHCDQL